MHSKIQIKNMVFFFQATKQINKHEIIRIIRRPAFALGLFLKVSIIMLFILFLNEVILVFYNPNNFIECEYQGILSSFFWNPKCFRTASVYKVCFFLMFSYLQKQNGTITSGYFIEDLSILARYRDRDVSVTKL